MGPGRLRAFQYLEVFRNRRMAVMVFMGFSSGLPLALTGSTLQAWMSVSGVDLRTIGIFALAGLPYTLKFLWSPLMDRFAPPWLGRRRGWIIISQAVLIACIAAMAFGSPREAPWALAVLALCIAFSSASQDIVVDAYRTDVLHEVERGAGAAVFVTGYRIANLVSGAFALIAADWLGWKWTYLMMSGLMLIGMASAYFGPDPENEVIPPRNLQEAVWGPLKNFFSRDGAFSLLLLIVLYKLGDAYAGTMTTPFLLRGVGFSLSEVGTVNKALGFASLIAGALLGGTLMVRFGLFVSLFAFGLLQAVSNLSFVLLAWVGKSYAVMIFAVAFENLTGGMGTAAFVSLLMTLCDLRFSATQFALLSSLAALGRVFISPSSGFVVEAAGWAGFFGITALTALPGLLLLWLMRSKISGLSQGAG